MNVLDLFSGIGGFSLGLERAGFRTVAFCECEPYAQRVLAKHWPGVPIYPDVRELDAARLAADGIYASVITAGFPCQDISYAGKGAGLAGERSGLWREVARLVGELRPRYAILENVSALLSRGLGDVLGDLAEIGYDCEWHCIPASYVGAPHRRDRIWIAAYPTQLQRNGGDDHPGGSLEAKQVSEPRNGSGPEGMADPASQRLSKRGSPGGEAGTAQTAAGVVAELERCRSDVADTFKSRQPRPGESVHARHPAPGAIGQAIDALYGRFRSEWATEPDVGRVANGVPARVDRLRCLGNAVVPQIPQLLGEAILGLDTL